MPFPPATESSSGLPHREMRDKGKKTGNKNLRSKGGMDGEKEVILNKDVTVSKKEGST